MYVLSDGTSLTETVRNAFKRGLTRAYIKYGNTIISQDNYLMNTKYKDEKADPENGQFIGVTSMRELTIKLYNANNSINLENQEVEYYVGALVNNQYKYIKFGNFIVQKAENQEVNEETTLTALDYMSKFDTDDEYVPQVVFPTTLLGLTQDICSQAGVVLGNTDFRNASVQILANPFVNGENYRTVLKSIAKLAFSPAYIGQDNKLYIGFNVTNTVTENITVDDFFENKPNDEIKPITAITLRSSEVKASGQTIYASDEMIEEYGINELVIEEDYLAYTDTLRNTYLNGATGLFGLTYKPLTIDLLGSIYLSFNDVIQVTNLQQNTYKTYALNNNHEFNGTLYNTISVPALTENEEKYKYETEDKTYKRKTAIEIDKANQRITSIVSEIGDRSQKTTTITQDIEGIESAVSQFEDLTLTVEGINPLELENCLSGNLLQLNIKGNNTIFSGLVPSDTLVPSNTLVPYGDSILKVYTINKCPDKSDNWINGYINRNTGQEIHTEPYNSAIILSPYIKIAESEFYISIENNNYKIYGITFYNSSKSFISNTILLDIEDSITIPNNTVFIRFEIVNKDYHYNETGYEDNFPAISPNEIAEIKPMITYSDEKEDYVAYNTQNINLGITEPLRQYSSTVYDEFVYNFEDETNKAKVIRRVGITSGGVLYELANEIIEILDIPDIILVQETNYIDFTTGYSANMIATYVQKTEFTEKFATTYQVQSYIKQLANQIMLVVNEKVGEDEFESAIILLSNQIALKVSANGIISALNLAVSDGQGIITITGNQLIINSDHYTMDRYGNIQISSNTTEKYRYTDFDIYLGMEYIKGNITLPNALLDLYDANNDNAFNITDIPKMINIKNGTENPTKTLNATVTINPNSSSETILTTLSSSLKTLIGMFQIYSYMLKTNRLFVGSGYYDSISSDNYGISIDGENQTIKLIDVNNQVGTTITPDTVESYYIISGVGQVKGYCMHGTDTAHYYLCNWTGSVLQFYVDGNVIGSLSDERLKNDINNVDERLIKAVEEIGIKQFKLKNKNGKITVGIIAQDLLEVFEKYELNPNDYEFTYESQYNLQDETLYYFVDYEQLLILQNESIRKRLNKCENDIEFLKEEIRKMKGENNG